MSKTTKASPDTLATMEPVVKAWVDAYLAERAGPAPEAWANAYKLFCVGNGEEYAPDARPSARWRFFCNCTHIWDRGGDPPKWDPKVELSYSEDAIEWEAEFDPEFRWLPPYPRYRSVLDPADPYVFDPYGGSDDPVALLGPNVLDLEARLAKVGITLLPDEGTGGDTDLTVEVDESGSVSVEINIRELPGQAAEAFAFRW